jgi:acetyl-CoA acyltransferase
MSIGFAASLIATGVHDVVIGAGVEHMGHLGFGELSEIQERYGSPYSRKLLDRHDIVGQGLGAEMIADAYGIDRAEMDELAVQSHRRAAAATAAGAFAREIVPIAAGDALHATDQGIRPDTDMEALGRLRPAFRPDGRITAGTASQISDGAAAVLLMARETAEAHGLAPRARIIDQVTVGCDPVRMLEGPIPATAKVLERNGLAIGDIDRIEINEAFASVVAAWQRVHGADPERVNARGGAMAIGHPLGSTGARLMTTLLHTLEDEDLELGLVTMCCGGGIGTGTLIGRA